MKCHWKPPEGAKVWKLLGQYKYVLIVIAAGVILLLWLWKNGGMRWRV